MGELSPLLAWRIIGLILVVVAVATGWRWSGDPIAPSPPSDHATVASDPLRARLSVRILPPRVPGSEAVLFLGNSRLGTALATPEAVAETLAAAGMADAQGGVLAGPWVRVADVERHLDGAAPFAPTVVVVQAELFFPAPERTTRWLDGLASAREVAPDRAATLALVDRLGPLRRLVVDPPLPARTVALLGPTWVARRAAALARLPGYEVHAEPVGWDDALFVDPLHLGPVGLPHLRRWLAAALAAGMEP